MNLPNIDPIDPDVPEAVDPDEDLVAQCLDLYLAQIGSDDTSLDPSTLENTAPAHVRERIARAKKCVEALESLSAAALHSHSSGDSLGSAEAELPPIAPGPRQTRIGRFHVLRELGSGGFGIVYLAWDSRIDRQVALKIPRIEVLASTELEQRFAQEARAAARLDHPNIVSVLEAGSDGMLPYIASIYYPGVTLAAWLRDHREGIAPLVVARLVRQLALALAHAHAHGVLHRDIKPSNILLVPDDEIATTAFALERATPRLMDFGLAKLVSENQDTTKTGALLGTLRYMPPEQAAGRTKEIGPASDVYGLGAVLYELLTGRAPFVAESDVEVLRKISIEEPTRVRLLRSTTPLDLETIALKCLEKEPARRYTSAQSLADDLDRFLHNIPIVARPATPRERLTKWCRRNPQLTAFLGLALFAVIGFVSFLLRSNAQLHDSLLQTAQERTRAEEQSQLALEREQAVREYAYGADMRLAQEAWDRSTPSEAQELLERHIPRNGEKDLRSIEWHYLWSSMHRYSQVVAQQASPVWSLASAPKQKLFATGDRAGVVRLWSLDPPRLIRELRGHDGGDINCLLFTPDGEKLITVGDDQAIRFWRVADGEPLEVLHEHHAWIGGMALSKNGTWLASGDAEGRVLMHNLDKNECTELYRHSGPVRSILFQPGLKGRWLVSLSEDGDIRVWDYHDNKPPDEAPTGKLEAPPGSFLRSAVFSDDGNGNWLFAISHGAMLIWDFRPGNDCRKLAEQVPMPGALSLAVSEDGKFMLAGGDDAHPDVFVRRMEKIEDVVRAVHGHSDTVRNFALLRDPNTFLSGSEDGTVRKWHLDPSDPNAFQRSFKSNIDALAWAADGKSLFVGLHDRELLMFSEPFDQEPVTLGRHADEIRGVAICADNRSVVSVDAEGDVNRWSLGTKIPPESFQIVTDVEQFSFTNSDQLLAYAQTKSLVAIDARTGQQRWNVEHPERIWAIESRGNTLFTACNDGVVRCFDASTGRLQRQTPAQRTAVRTVAFSQDGQRMVTGSTDKTIRIYDALTFAEQFRFSHSEGIQRVFFFDRDRRLLVCDAKFFAIVNPATGQTMLKIPNHRYREGIAAVNPSGTMLVVPQGNDLIFLSLVFH